MTTSDAAFHLAAMWETKNIEAATHDRLAFKVGRANRERHENAAKWAREQCDALDVAMRALLPLP